MIGEGRVSELLSIYLAAREAGQPPPIEDLCRDCPELVTELRQQIDVLGKFDRLAGGDTDDISRAAAADTDNTGALPAGPAAIPQFERYEVIDELGRGGMGVVYKARDMRTGRVVALKTMKLAGGRALELFKGEFRYLQGVSHPNLVQLYALEAERSRWLLTMEFVDGVNFLDYLHPPAESAAAMETPRPVVTPPAALDEQTGAWTPHNAAARPLGCDPLRLRDAFGQLAEGIAALHSHRRVHRDLKPQNVRVATNGRVVVLDFGLTAALDHAGEYLASVMMGTAAYMAPEQGDIPPVATAASDWYALGVMLYQALTGVLPFRGRSLLDLIAQKRTAVPPHPRELCPDVSDELDALCMGLLNPRPEERPTGEQVLRAFGRGESVREMPTAPADAPLLGRERHLAELRAAYTAVRPAEAVVVKVSGPSGIGKSALVGHFLDQLREAGAVVLSGRCYEHESVPYKALDPLVDELARYLHSLPEDQAAALVPAAVGPLVRVFPVLERVEPIARAAADARLSPDPLELRRQAFAGLRDLLGRLARVTRLVLHVDDLQWGDVDSAYLIADLIQPPDPPAALWVLAHRSEDAGSACLTTLAEVLARSGAADVRDLPVAPLTEDETRALVTASLGPAASERVAEIASESGGNPYFVMELVRSAGAESGSQRDGPAGDRLTLDGLIRSRVARLPVGAKRLLELVAVSGRPLRDLDAYTAAGAEDARTLMARLEAGRFLRGVGSADELRLETYHDRVREAVTSGLGDDLRRAHHGRLADVLETSGRGDLEELALHFEGAGAGEKAGGYYRQAGDRAASAVAFDQAAGFYQKAIDLQRLEGEQSRALKVKLAEALANAGRGAEAGPAYLAAAVGTFGTEQADLCQNAMRQFLVSGRTDEAVKLYQSLLATFGLRLPTGRRRQLLLMVWEILRLRLRGTKFQERPAADIPQDVLQRIDVTGATSGYFAFVNPAWMYWLMARGARWALDAGEPTRAARALSVAGFMSAMEGVKAYRRAERATTKAREMCARLGYADEAAHTELDGAGACWAVGRWDDTLVRLAVCERIVAEQRVPFAYFQTGLRHFRLDALMMTGAWREFTELVGPYLEDGRRKGDKFASSAMLVHSYLPALAAGQPGQVEDLIRQAWEAWPQKGNVMGVYWGLYAKVEAALYRGDPAAAAALLAREEGEAGGHTHYKLMEILRLVMAHLEGRAMLASAGTTAPTGRYFGVQRRLIRAAALRVRRIERPNAAWANPLAKLLRGGVANLRDQQDDAAQLLNAAADGFDAAGMRMYAAAARRQRGRLLGGDEGRELIRLADDFMTAEGVREPDRIAHMLAPGFPD